MNTTKQITHIIKRNGRKVEFKEGKITHAISKAFFQTQTLPTEPECWDEAKRLTPIAIDLFKHRINGETPSVESMQDVVEQVLMAAGHYHTAKHYILYRAEHKKERDAKSIIGVKDDIGLTVNQLKVLERRYLRHNEEGDVIETPKEMFARVANAVAINEPKDQEKWAKRFSEILASLEFLPAGCYLRGAGTKRQMLANCFVLPVDDSMEGIFDSVKWMAMVHQKGGGTGFNFSSLRPKGDYVVSSGGFSSGPISFMKVFDAATRQVMQGGFKRGANMGILNIDHPDILEFINCKLEEDEINNFNISIGMKDDFMQAVESDDTYDLKNPRNGDVVQTVQARNLFNQIVTLAWRTGDPGMIFLDEINRHNPLIDTLGPMLATNPCGEQPLHPFDVCNLGSLNLAKFVVPSTDFENPFSQINWRRLEKVTRLAVRFLDNGVDVSTYPVDKIAETAKSNRRIGLGVMGFADMLYQLRTPYESAQGVEIAEKVMKFINAVAHLESESLAIEKGVFKNYPGSTYDQKNIKQRNIAITTIAPTGTISMVADASSGIEPVFALSYTKNVVDDKGLLYINPYFEQALNEAVTDKDQREQILEEVSKTGSCQHVNGVPEAIKRIFQTAHDITPMGHVRMQAAFQTHTDNAVSKTINFPNHATIADVEQAYLEAWHSKCKGITIYRDGSKNIQILNSAPSSDPHNEKNTVQVQSQKKSELIIQSKIKIKTLKERIKENHQHAPAITQQVTSRPKNRPHHHHHSKEAVLSKAEALPHKQVIYSADVHPQSSASSEASPCPECGVTLQMSEGCMTCYACGWSKCSL